MLPILTRSSGMRINNMAVVLHPEEKSRTYVSDRSQGYVRDRAREYITNLRLLLCDYLDT